MTQHKLPGQSSNGQSRNSCCIICGFGAGETVLAVKDVFVAASITMKTDDAFFVDSAEVAFESTPITAAADVAAATVAVVAVAVTVVAVAVGAVAAAVAAAAAAAAAASTADAVSIDVLADDIIVAAAVDKMDVLSAGVIVANT